jgi:hypothetical protein
MHRRDSFDAAARRVMHRTQIRSTPDLEPPVGGPPNEPNRPAVRARVESGPAHGS